MLIFCTKKAKTIIKILPVLDPNVKLAYAEDKWDSEAMQDGMESLEAVVCLTLKSSVIQLIYVTYATV